MLSPIMVSQLEDDEDIPTSPIRKQKRRRIIRELNMESLLIENEPDIELEDKSFSLSQKVKEVLGNSVLNAMESINNSLQWNRNCTLRKDDSTLGDSEEIEWSVDEDSFRPSRSLLLAASLGCRPDEDVWSSEMETPTTVRSSDGRLSWEVNTVERASLFPDQDSIDNVVDEITENDLETSYRDVATVSHITTSTPILRSNVSRQSSYPKPTLTSQSSLPIETESHITTSTPILRSTFGIQLSYPQSTVTSQSSRPIGTENHITPSTPILTSTVSRLPSHSQATNACKSSCPRKSESHITTSSCILRSTVTRQSSCPKLTVIRRQTSCPLKTGSRISISTPILRSTLTKSSSHPQLSHRIEAESSMTTSSPNTRRRSSSPRPHLVKKSYNVGCEKIGQDSGFGSETNLSSLDFSVQDQSLEINQSMFLQQSAKEEVSISQQSSKKEVSISQQSAKEDISMSLQSAQKVSLHQQSAKNVLLSHQIRKVSNVYHLSEVLNRKQSKEEMVLCSMEVMDKLDI